MDWELKFFGILFFGNIVIAHVSRKAAPESWAGTLIIASAVPNTLAILIAVKTAWGMYQGRIDGLGGLLVLPGTLILVEFLWLLYIYFACFRGANPPPPDPKYPGHGS